MSKLDVLENTHLYKYAWWWGIKDYVFFIILLNFCDLCVRWGRSIQKDSFGAIEILIVENVSILGPHTHRRVLIAINHI